MLEGPEEVLTVLIILEYGFLFIAARGHMIDSAWVFYAKGTGHGPTVTWSRHNVNSIDLTLRSPTGSRLWEKQP
jgi:hypothetical protein